MTVKDNGKISKVLRGNASQFFVAGELCRRSIVSVVTMGNCPNTDILCSNLDGTKFAHVQVKTFVPGNSTCSVGPKAEKDYGAKFFWVLGGIPLEKQENQFEFYVIPSGVLSTKIRAGHQKWLDTPGRGGKKHNKSDFRTVTLPPKRDNIGWDITEFRDRWDLIQNVL